MLGSLNFDIAAKDEMLKGVKYVSGQLRPKAPHILPHKKPIV